MGKQRSSRLCRLSGGRPPTAQTQHSSMKSKHTRRLINEHHQINKQLAKADQEGDKAKADDLRKRMHELGGLEVYQRASIQGQANDRGGDSSTVLMDWLEGLVPSPGSTDLQLRMLEIGSLKTTNACSRSGIFDIVRIDLHSQAEGIIQQDFMERPLPTCEGELFDIISLSLVLNFVPDAESRGQMLRRTCHFLRRRQTEAMVNPAKNILPALFLVLPAPCITNSRYMNEERLTLMMESLGYVAHHRKQTAKLVYYLWQLTNRTVSKQQKFDKQEVNPGRKRNNFSIVIR